MRPAHVASTLYIVNENPNVVAGMAIEFNGCIQDYVFRITRFACFDDSRSFSLALTREELGFLMKDPLEFGKYGHITVYEHPDDCFTVRDEFAKKYVLGKADYLSPPVKVNGSFRKRLQSVARAILHDIDLASKYITNDGNVTTITWDDSEILENLIVSYVFDRQNLINEREQSIKVIVEGITRESFNAFITPCKLRIGNSVDIRAAADSVLGGHHPDYRFEYTEVTPTARWVRHMYRCNGKCIREKK